MMINAAAIVAADEILKIFRDFLYSGSSMIVYLLIELKPRIPQTAAVIAVSAVNMIPKTAASYKKKKITIVEAASSDERLLI